MKKVHLTIPEPCHENWDEMTQADKGKYCASCQKNVIDFSLMTDRQLAEFFKKPASGLCGHFREDQLDRDIPIYKKRIPWLRYFFQLTWPAMVWMLKSCGMKQSVKGQTMLDSPVKNETPKIMKQLVGFLLPNSDGEIESVQLEGIIGNKVYANSKNNKINTSRINAIIKNKKEKVTNIQQKIMEDESKIEERLGRELKASENILRQNDIFNALQGRVGPFVVYNKCKNDKPEKMKSQKMEIKQIPPTDTYLVHVFPNPVHAGSLLTINSEHEDGLPSKIQIINSSGQQVMVMEPDADEKSTVLNIRIPEQLTAGVYFLRMMTRDEKVVTKKIMIQ